MPRGRKTTKSSKSPQPTVTKTARPSKTPQPTLKQPKNSSNLPTTYVQTYAELKDALAQRRPKITLLDNIIAPENLLINHDVIIDFNSYSIISEESHASARVLDIRSGSVTLTGQGKIFAMGKQSVAIRTFGAISSSIPNYTTLNVDRSISIFAPDSYGIMIAPNLGVAYGLTINFAGQIFARDGIGLSGSIRADDQHLPTINIHPGAQIVADETSGVALDAIGHGQWLIESANLSGAAGVNLASGTLTFRRSQIIARDITFNLCASEAQHLKATIESGTYLAEHKANFAGASSPSAKITLKSGKFYSPDPNILPEAEASVKAHVKATFSHDVEKILAQIAATAAAQQEAEQSSTATTETSPSRAQSIEETNDEALILAELNAEEEEPEAEAPAAPAPAITSVLPPPPLPTPVTNEQSAARMALADAINDIRNLNSRDYDTGFSELEQVIQHAEKILANPKTSISDIFTAASQLLQAFDGLKQDSEDTTLTDAELDELFYHGAVLEEMVSDPSSEPAPEPSTPATTIPEASTPEIPLPEMPTMELYQPIPEELPFEDSFTDEPSYDLALLEEDDEVSPLNTMATQLSLQAQDYDTSEPIATDFGQITAILNLVADLDLSRYLSSTQASLLEALAEAEEVLHDPDCSQEDIDEVAELLTDGLRALELVRNAHLAVRAPKVLPHTSTPAPVPKQSILATMIDEMAPTPIWTSGTTMIDEMTPFTTDPDTFAKMVRMTHPAVRALAEAALRPIQKLSHSLAAGAKAGWKVYRETLRAFKS